MFLTKLKPTSEIATTSIEALFLSPGCGKFHFSIDNSVRYKILSPLLSGGGTHLTPVTGPFRRWNASRSHRSPLISGGGTHLARLISGGGTQLSPVTAHFWRWNTSRAGHHPLISVSLTTLNGFKSNDEINRYFCIALHFQQFGY